MCCQCYHNLLNNIVSLTVKDSCVPNPCNNEAICAEMDDGYHCTCKLGYKGDQCQSKQACLTSLGKKNIMIRNNKIYN